jgi:molecular chaperone Hsp33
MAESSSSSSMAPQLSETIISVSFVRHRNVLLVKGDLSPLFVDYLLHVQDHGLNYGELPGFMLKEGLAAFVLHCASRPRNEHIAWTLNFQQPLMNLFLAGDNEDCTVVGRLFTEGVKWNERNLFYSDIVTRRGEQPRRSIVHFGGTSLFTASETYYAASEQRTARYFDLGNDEYALLVSHPDCDLAWLQGLGISAVRALDENETLTLIEQRRYHWSCGCNQEKIMRVIAQAYNGDPDAIFGGEETIRAQCPRCAAIHTITREAMEAYRAKSPQGGA